MIYIMHYLYYFIFVYPMIKSHDFIVPNKIRPVPAAVLPDAIPGASKALTSLNRSSEAIRADPSFGGRGENTPSCHPFYNRIRKPPHLDFGNGL